VDGGGAIILAAVTTGDDALVGVGSVVTRDARRRLAIPRGEALNGDR